MWMDEQWCFECVYRYYDSFHDEEYCDKHRCVMNIYCSESDTPHHNYAEDCDDYLNAEQVRKEKVKRECLFDKDD